MNSKFTVILILIIPLIAISQFLLIEENYIGLILLYSSTILIILFLNLKFDFIYIIPIFSVLADITIEYFPQTAYFNSGYLRTILLTLFIILLFIKKYKFHPLFRIIFLITTYFLGLVFLSSDIMYSFLIYLKSIIPFFLFIAAYILISDTKNFKKFSVAIIISNVIVLVNFIIAQVLRIGRSIYIEESFYLGGGGIALPIYLAFFSIGLMLIIQNIKWGKYKPLLIIMFFGNILILGLIARRGPILACLMGIIIYFYNTSHKTKIIRVFFIIAVLAVVTYPMYESTLITRIQYRLEKRELAEEGRIIYTKIVLDEFMNKSIKHSLIGSELFNSGNYFRLKTGRGLHADFNILLHGSGIIGLILYYMFFIKSLIYFRHKRLLNKRNKYTNNIISLGIALISTYFIISFSKGLTVLGPMSILFLFLGAVLGNLGNKKFK